MNRALVSFKQPGIIKKDESIFDSSLGGFCVANPGIEPGSPPWEGGVLGHYTKSPFLRLSPLRGFWLCKIMMNISDTQVFRRIFCVKVGCGNVNRWTIKIYLSFNLDCSESFGLVKVGLRCRYRRPAQEMGLRSWWGTFIEIAAGSDIGACRFNPEEFHWNRKHDAPYEWAFYLLKRTAPHRWIPPY